MKSLIKYFILVIILIGVLLSIWGGPALEKTLTYILQTQVDISRAKFAPHRFMFKLYGIDMPEKDILITLGTLSLFPIRVELYGLKIEDKIILGPKDFWVDISRHRGWEINGLFKGVDLGRMDYGFVKGEIRGAIEGVYMGGNCKFYGTLQLRNIIYSDTNGRFLGIPSGEFKKIIDIYNGNLELDFTYSGPLNGIDELYRYRPGRKTLALIKRYLLSK